MASTIGRNGTREDIPVIVDGEVTTPCRRCGQPVVLRMVDGRLELPDVTEFLRQHRQCLRQP